MRGATFNYTVIGFIDNNQKINRFVLVLEKSKTYTYYVF